MNTDSVSDRTGMKSGNIISKHSSSALVMSMFSQKNHRGEAGVSISQMSLVLSEFRKKGTMKHMIAADKIRYLKKGNVET